MEKDLDNGSNDLYCFSAVDEAGMYFYVNVTS